MNQEPVPWLESLNYNWFDTFEFEFESLFILRNTNSSHNNALDTMRCGIYNHCSFAELQIIFGQGEFRERCDPLPNNICDESGLIEFHYRSKYLGLR